MRTDSTHSWRQIARCGFHAAGWAGAALLVVRSASPLLAGEPSDIVPHLAFFAGVFATGALLRRWSFALRLLTACVLLAWVAWRPEELADGRLPLAIRPAIDAALLALACDRLLAAATSFGPTRAGRALRAATALAAAAFVVLAATGRLDGRKPAQHANAYQQRSRLTTTVLDHLRVRSAAIERTFGSFADLERRHAARLNALNSACDPDSACLDYYRALRDMLAELSDGHTRVNIPGETTAPPVWIEPIGGEPVIADWNEDPAHGVTGLRRGLAVETVDGRPVREVLEDRPAWLLARASEHRTVTRRTCSILAGPPGTLVRVGVRDPGAHRRQFTFRRPVYADTVGGGAPPEVANLTQSEDDEESAIEVIPPREEGEPFVIRIDRFTGRTLHPRFSRALQVHLGAPGMVLDIRGNPGGWAGNALDIAGHFFRHAWKAGAWISFDRTKPPTEDRSESDILVAPILPIFEGPVAVLTDHDTASAGDLLAYTLCRSGRARCFGRTSAGEVHSAWREWVGGVRIGVAECAFRPSLPGRLHGFGVVPHEPVERTLRDVVSGRDADLDAATRWLATQRGRTGLAWRTDLPRPVDGKNGHGRRGTGDSVRKAGTGISGRRTGTAENGQRPTASLLPTLRHSDPEQGEGEESRRLWSAVSTSSLTLERHEILRSPLRASLRMTECGLRGSLRMTFNPSVILRPEGPKDLAAPGARRARAVPASGATGSSRPLRGPLRMTFNPSVILRPEGPKDPVASGAPPLTPRRSVIPTLSETKGRNPLAL